MYVGKLFKDMGQLVNFKLSIPKLPCRHKCSVGSCEDTSHKILETYSRSVLYFSPF